jgi:tRNA threonylcarbamoyladenosine biosynthesis protein TsaB
MALILCIETSHSTASVALCKDEDHIAFRESTSQKEHASFLQPAIQDMMKEVGLTLDRIDALSVSIGPGSYTGLRVGLASAKGICYALNKPLITIDSLTIIAHLAKKEILNNAEPSFIVPMIDARRDEVFFSIFDHQLRVIAPPQAHILTDQSFEDVLSKPVFFAGDGTGKWKLRCMHPKASFRDIRPSAREMVSLSLEAWHHQNFASLSHSTPLYAKEFYSTIQKPG